MAAGELVRADQEQIKSGRESVTFVGKAWEPQPFRLTFDFTSKTGASVLELKFPDKTLTFTREELQREFEAQR